MVIGFFFFQAEDGIRDAQESRGLGDVYKRQFSSAANSSYVASSFSSLSFIDSTSWKSSRLVSPLSRRVVFSSRIRLSAVRACGYSLASSIQYLSLIHISEPTRLLSISYAVFCLKKKK